MIDASAIAEDFRHRSGAGAREVSFIELNRSGPPRPAVALLVFLDGQPEPRAFVKATSAPERGKDLRREFNNLSRLQRLGNEPFLQTVPAPIYCVERGDLTVLAETATPGTRMKDFPPDKYFTSRSFRNHLAAAMDWLDGFRLALAGDEPKSAVAPAADRIATTFDRYRRSYSVSPALQGLLDETLRTLGNASFPAVPWHGDFCTANVVVPDDQRIYVIDWEYPLEKSWPLSDLLYFVCSTWSVPYAKGLDALKTNYGTLFFENHAFSDALRTSVDRHLQRLGIDRALLLPLSVVTWATYANRKQDELAAMPHDDPARHMPLIMIENRTCLNLEILAEKHDRYL